MQPKALTGLFVATILAVGLAAFSSLGKPGSVTNDARGTPAFPGLLEKANQMTALKIDAGDWSGEIKRDGEQFLDASGYPVKLQPIRAIITGLATLTFEEAKTADPERYGDLELDDPGPASSAGRLVQVLKGDEVLASLVIGERDLTAGGMRGGIFARLFDDPQSWLLRGTVELPDNRGDLFDSQLLSWNTNDVAQMTISDAQDVEPLVFTSATPGEALLAVDLPVEQQTDAQKVLGLSALVNNLTFDDVRPAKADATVLGSVVYQTRDGVVVTVERLAMLDGDKPVGETGWVRLSVLADSAATKAGQERVAQLTKRVQGFDFTLYETAYETISYGPAKLLKPVQG